MASYQSRESARCIQSPSWLLDNLVCWIEYRLFSLFEQLDWIQNQTLLWITLAGCKSRFQTDIFLKLQANFPMLVCKSNLPPWDHTKFVKVTNLFLEWRLHCFHSPTLRASCGNERLMTNWRACYHVEYFKMLMNVSRSTVQWALPPQLQVALEAPSIIILKSSDDSRTWRWPGHKGVIPKKVFKKNK